MGSNDEVERRALTVNGDALSQSFDLLLTSPKLRGRSNRLLGSQQVSKVSVAWAHWRCYGASALVYDETLDWFRGKSE
jgi:hypothetical protein